MVLTATSTADTMYVMSGFNSRRRRSVTWAMTIAVAVAFFAACAPAEASSAADHACCAAMKHECGPHGEPQQCCSTEKPQISGVTIAKHVLAKPLVAIVSSSVAADLRLDLEASRDALSYLVPVKPPGVARHVLLATFRI